MGLVEVKVIPATFNFSIKSKMITGEIFVEVDGQRYPSENWNDFVVVILGWWINALEALVVGHTSYAQLRFMDGPYSFELEKIGYNKVDLSFFRNGKHKQIIDFGSFRLADILATTLFASEQCISECKLRGWQGNEIIELEKKILQVKTP